MIAIVISLVAIALSIASVMINILSARDTRRSMRRVAVLRAETEATVADTKRIVAQSTAPRKPFRPGGPVR